MGSPVGQHTPAQTNASSAAGRSDQSNLRILVPGDEPALDRHLSRFAASSVAMRANLQSGGIVDQGQPYQGTYAALWDRDTILAVAAHYWNGALMLQAPRALGEVIRAAVAGSRRPVTFVQGPWPQVQAAADILGPLSSQRWIGKVNDLRLLDIGKLQIPDSVKRREARHRVATAADLNYLLSWEASREAEISGTTESLEQRARVRAKLEQLIAQTALYVAETTATPSRIVAMAYIEYGVQGLIQIGGIWSPPLVKDKGFAAVAVAGAVFAAQAHGFKQACLLADKASTATLNSYRALGFTSIGEYGYLLPAR